MAHPDPGALACQPCPAPTSNAPHAANQATPHGPQVSCRRWRALGALLSSQLRRCQGFWASLTRSSWAGSQHRLAGTRQALLQALAQLGQGLHRLRGRASIRLAAAGTSPRLRRLLGTLQRASGAALGRLGGLCQSLGARLTAEVTDPAVACRSTGSSGRCVSLAEAMLHLPRARAARQVVKHAWSGCCGALMLWLRCLVAPHRQGRYRCC